MRITIISITAILALLVTFVVGACNNNGICNAETESCLDCPSDCSCNFEGVKLDQWNCLPSSAGLGTCLKNSTSSVSFDLYDTGAGPLTAVMTSYLRIPTEGDKTFKLIASNVGARVTINNETIIDSYFHQPVITSSRRVTLRSDLVHVIKVELFSIGNTKKLSLYWKDSDDYDAPFVAVNSMFFSNNVCGDGIPNTSGAACTEQITISQSAPSCGDGICIDPLPDNCFVDCHSHISERCSPIAVPPGSLSTELPIATDSIGALIKNQFLWHLPGIEHLSFGVNIVNGEELLAPLFYFGFCDTNSLQLMQDSYRGVSYTIPEQLTAQPSPQCKFSVDSAKHSSAVSIADSLATKAGLDLSANGNVGWGKVKLTASAAYSQEESVKKAHELSSTKTGSLVVTEVSCETSKVQLNKINFHPNFLKDLASANTNADFLKLVKKYGTHYYKRATLGGRLRQVTTMDSSYEQQASSSEISSNVEKAFAASLSSPVFSASGDYSSSLDQTHSAESQTSFQQNSFRSTVITYGGAPGSFGPTTSEAPSTFGDWASSVDLLPVPINYQLESIGSIIPDQWKLKNGTAVNTMWQAGESLYRAEIDDLDTTNRAMYKYTLYWSFSPEAVFVGSSPTELMFYSVNIDGEQIPITVATDYIGNGAPLQMIQNGPNKTPRLVIFDFYSTKKMTSASTFAVEAEGGPPTTWTDDVTFQSYGTHGGYIRIVDWSTGTCFTGDSTTFLKNPSTGVLEPRWTRRLLDSQNTIFIFFRLRHLNGPLISSANFRLQLIDNKKTVYNYSPSWSDLPSENNTMGSVRFNMLASLTPNVELPFTELRIQMLGDRRFAATTYEISGIFVARNQYWYNSDVFTTYASGYRAKLTSKSLSYISIPLMRAKK